MPSIVVVIPTYNELNAIGDVIARTLVTLPEAHILIVDDNSPDGTGALVDGLAAADPRINVIHRTEKSGLGTAYVAGFRWALERNYDRIVEMDADGSHQPEELPLMMKKLDGGADLVIGTRWIPGGKTVNWPWTRRLISRSGTTYSRIMLGSKLHDITSGYRGFSADMLKKIDLSTVDSGGYCFQIELAWLVERTGASVQEFPITFIERVEGQSKMSSNIVFEALYKVTIWGLGARFGRRGKARTIDTPTSGVN